MKLPIELLFAFGAVVLNCLLLYFIIKAATYAKLRLSASIATVALLQQLTKEKGLPELTLYDINKAKKLINQYDPNYDYTPPKATADSDFTTLFKPKENAGKP